MKQTLSDLESAMKRLASAGTPIKRKNARKAFAKAMRELTAWMNAEYPKMRKDGSLIDKRNRRGAWCPYCKVPKKSFTVLLSHLRLFHDFRHKKCICNKHFSGDGDYARHLAGQKSLAEHFALAALKESAGVI